uniref:Protein aurora borealis n=1 Tax=Rhodnius prolixus TaxID=13249 RepID=T1HHV6_RHOPR
MLRSTGPTRSWKTSPLRNTFQESPKSSLLFAAQSRAFSNKQLQNQPSTSSFVKTPRLCRTNPFEDISSLEYDKCSPGMFIVRQTNDEKSEFKWSIEDISRIMPAQIESPKSPPEENFDEETENAAQEAIEKYFSLRHAVISPQSTCGEALPSPEMSTPPAELFMVRAAMACRSSSSFKGYSSGAKGMLSAISSTPCARSAAERRHVIKVDECSQTQLSFPPVLPPEVESVLRPYMSYKDDNCETEECNISSVTLRRKLFFNKDDHAISPVNSEKNGRSLNDSPMQHTRPSRIDWTPDEKERQLYCLSSPDISPIKCKPSFEFPKDMSIDCSSFSQNNPNDNGNSDQPLAKPMAFKFSSLSTENETYLQGRGIFSSTVQSSQIDRTDKDTGYSTMEIDCTPSLQAQVMNKII